MDGKQKIMGIEIALINGWIWIGLELNKKDVKLTYENEYY